MVSRAIMSKVGAAVLAMALGAAMLSSAGETEKAPPKELVQYVRDSRRLGLKETSIKQKAIAGGWSAATVDEAIAYVNKTPTADATASVEASPTAAKVPSIAQAPAPLPDRHSNGPDTAKNRGVPEDYVIGAGDVLQISVWKEPEASVPSVVVRPDGKIAMPLLKEVDVLGMTPTQAETAITERLTRFIIGA